MSAYTTDTLLADVRTTAMLPAASSATFTDADLLRLADRELQSKVVPMVMRVREEFFVWDADATLVYDTGPWSVGYRIPYRAIGGKLREVQLVTPQGTYMNLPQVSLDDLAAETAGFVIRGNLVYLYNPRVNWSATTIRFSYFMRPNRLVPTSSARQILTVDSPTQVTLAASPPAGFTSNTPMDFVRAAPGFECMDIDQRPVVAGSTLTFTSLPNALAVGDWVCLAEESPIPQIPPEAHPYLVQRVVCKVLESIGDREGLAAAQAKAAELEQDILTLLSPRVVGEPRKFANRQSPFRRRTRWTIIA